MWPGKSDLYHAFQATLIPRLDPSVSVAPALKDRVDGINAAPGANATARQLRFDVGRFPVNVALAIMSCM